MFSYEATSPLKVFGLPHVVTRSGGGRSPARRPFIGQGDGALALPVFRAPDGQVKFILTLGMNRPNVAARQTPGVLPDGCVPLAQPLIDRRNGIMVEGAAGSIEQGEGVSCALKRETEEEIGITGGTTLEIGQPTYPDCQVSLERHFYGILVSRADPDKLRPVGDDSRGEIGLVPFCVNFNGLLELEENGHMPYLHFLLMALRLRAALGAAGDALAWDRPAQYTLPRNAARGVTFDKLVTNNTLPGDDGNDLIVRTCEYSVTGPGGNRQKIGFPAMVSFPRKSLDSVSLFVTFNDGGQNYVIVPRPQPQLIYGARRLAAARLIGVTLTPDRETFSSGLTFPVDVADAPAINRGTLSLADHVTTHCLEGLLGKAAAHNAVIQEPLGPTTLSGGIVSRLARSFTVEMRDPNQVHLAPDLQAVALEEALEKVRTGELTDMVFEAQALRYALAKGLPLPDYTGFDTRGFWGEI